MVADYVILANERRVRVEINLNTLKAWQTLTGCDLLSIDGVHKDSALLLALAFCGAQVGEELDGRVLELTEAEFGGLCRIAQVMQFVQVINRQSVVAEKKNVPGRKGK